MLMPSSAVSGMMLSLVPACSRPTVTTAVSAGETWRATMPWSRVTMCAAMENRVDGGLGAGAVTPLAVQDHLHGVAGGHDRPAGVTDHPGRQRTDMLTEHDARHREPPEQAVIHHVLGAAAQFLGRLEHYEQSPGPGAGGAGEQGRCTQQAGGVHVMPAGVHDRDLFPVLAASAGRAHVRAGRAQSFLDRQGVEVSAQHHHWAVAVAQQPDYPRAADLLGDLEAQRPQRVGDWPGGAVLVQRQLRMLSMQVPVEVRELGTQFPLARPTWVSVHKLSPSGASRPSPCCRYCSAGPVSSPPPGPVCNPPPGPVCRLRTRV